MNSHSPKWVCTLCDAIVFDASQPSLTELVPQAPELPCPDCNAPNTMFSLIPASSLSIALLDFENYTFLQHLVPLADPQYLCA